MVGKNDQEKYEFLPDGRVMMKLPFENRWRNIGSIIKENFIRVENMHGVHVKTDSFSMPHALLLKLQAQGIKGIVMVFEGVRYTTTVDTYLKEGKFLYFKGRSEKKVYLNRDRFRYPGHEPAPAKKEPVSVEGWF